MWLWEQVRGFWGSRSREQPEATLVPDDSASRDARLEALLAARQVQRYEIERWRMAFDLTPEAALLLNQAGVVLFANQAARKLLESDALDGRDFDDVLARSAARPRPWREPLADVRGADLGSLVLLREPGAGLPAQGAFLEFLSHISHELKSPLNTIRSYAEMLMDGSIEEAETRKEFFNVITEESCRLAKLVDNLLDLSKIDAGALAPERSRLRPDSLLNELVRAAEPQARSKGLELQAEVPTNLPSAFGDKDLVAVAISNLISNAIKYTPAGGRIAVRARAEEETLVVEVQDSGIGIPRDEQKKVFEKFYRGSGRDVRQQSGTGLGLALAQQIIRLHGGTLRLDSEPGKGTTFRIDLPLGGKELREAFGLPEAE